MHVQGCTLPLFAVVVYSLTALCSGLSLVIVKELQLISKRSVYKDTTQHLPTNPLCLDRYTNISVKYKRVLLDNCLLECVYTL